jgi:hypothetical protein
VLAALGRSPRSPAGRFRASWAPCARSVYAAWLERGWCLFDGRPGGGASSGDGVETTSGRTGYFGNRDGGGWLRGGGHVSDHVLLDEEP